MTSVEIREFVKDNGNVLTNQQMAIACGEPRTRISSAISKCKLSGDIKLFGWLKSEQPTKANVKKGLKRIFDKVDAIGKNQARESMAMGVATSGVGGMILSLPSYTCAIEKLILDYTRSSTNNLFTFFGVERKELAHKEMLATADRLGIEFEGTSKKDILYTIERAKENDLAHVLLDLCGQVHKHEQDIALTINNDIIKVGGLFCITLVRRLACGNGTKFREKIESIIPYDNNLFDSQGNRVTQIDQVILNFIKIESKGKFELVEEPFRYCDPTINDEGKKVVGSKMILIMLKRVK